VDETSGWAKSCANAVVQSSPLTFANPNREGALYLDARRRVIGVLALDVVGGRIASINAVVNPDKLTHLGPVGDLASLIRSAR
jgi:hypothetical protein